MNKTIPTADTKSFKYSDISIKVHQYFGDSNFWNDTGIVSVNNRKEVRALMTRIIEKFNLNEHDIVVDGYWSYGDKSGCDIVFKKRFGEHIDRIGWARRGEENYKTLLQIPELKNGYNYFLKDIERLSSRLL